MNQLNLLNLKKVYKILLLKSSIKLYFLDVQFCVTNFLASIIFAKTKRPNKFLRVLNGYLTKKICARQRIFERCQLIKGRFLNFIRMPAGV